MGEVFQVLLVLAVIFLWVGQSRLKKRLKKLEGLADLDTSYAPEPGAPKPWMDTEDAAEREDPALASTGPWDAKVDQKAASESAPDTSAIVEEPSPEPDRPSRAFVFRRDKLSAARQWITQNWFLVIAALSLALAGVFLVQYGVENGLLSPFWRVMGAAFFGTALIWGGEFIRRRSGDHRESHTAFLPSTFSGAGLVALFAAVLSAHQLYGLIGAEGAFVYLVMVSAVAIVLGWFYGPFLAVVGILGSLGAPFLVEGSDASPTLFFYYFALVVIAALVVDAVKRWAWVSVFALGFGFLSAWAVWASGGGGEHFLVFAVITAIAAATVPVRKLWPEHQGQMGLIGWFKPILAGKDEKRDWPEFPTRIASGAFAAAVWVGMLVATDGAGQAEAWLGIAALCLLFLVAVVLYHRSPALDDLAPVAALGFTALVVAQAGDLGPIFQNFHLERAPGVGPSSAVAALAILALIGSALACWRSLWGGERAQHWAAGSALFAPLVLVVLEVFWGPEPVLGAGLWASHGIVIAAAMVFFAGLVARRDGEDKRRVAYFALAAITMITFALVIILSSVALTIALAVMVVVSAWFDRQLGLRPLTWFVHAGTIAIGWRLVLDPGIGWATSAPLVEMVLAFSVSAILLVAAWVLLADRARTSARLTVESGIWAILGVLVCLLLYRAMGNNMDSHYGVSLFGSIWLMLMMVQLYRTQIGGRLRFVRYGLATLYGLAALFFFGMLLLVFNPLGNGFAGRELVVGPPLINSLFVAFVIPALIFAVGAWRLPILGPKSRAAMMTFSALFLVAYLALTIRHLWQGADLSARGASQGELYSYTIAMLLGSVGLLFAAFRRRSVTLRRVATAGIALTIAKVFLVDMSGLAGLMRVASFLGLGLSLAGLGWVYRRMAAAWDDKTPTN